MPVCPDCRGKPYRQFSADRSTCPVCHGARTVFIGSGLVPCTECTGDGEVTRYSMGCELCDNKGWINDPTSENYRAPPSGSPRVARQAPEPWEPSTTAAILGVVVLPVATVWQAYVAYTSGWGWWSALAVVSGVLTAGAVVLLFDGVVQSLAILIGICVVAAPIALAGLWRFDPASFQALKQSVVREYERWRQPDVGRIKVDAKKERKRK